MNTTKNPTPPAGGQGQHGPFALYFGDDSAQHESGFPFVEVHCKDSQPDAKVLYRNVDTPANRSLAAFIVDACNSHSALVRQNEEMRGLLLRMADEARHQNQARNGFNPGLEREARATALNGGAK